MSTEIREASAEIRLFHLGKRTGVAGWMKQAQANRRISLDATDTALLSYWNRGWRPQILTDLPKIMSIPGIHEPGAGWERYAPSLGCDRAFGGVKHVCFF
jgi:hypothetical protein